MPFDSTPGKTDDIELLAQDLERTRTFDLVKYSHECGTPACIAGHAVVRWPDVQHPAAPGGSGGLLPLYERLAARLEVSEARLRMLCLPVVQGLPRRHRSPSASQRYGVDAATVTGKMAAAALRRLRDTGEAWFDPKDA